MGTRKELKIGDKIKLKNGVKPIPLLDVFFVPYFFTEENIGEILEYPNQMLCGKICFETAIIGVNKWGYKKPRKVLVYVEDLEIVTDSTII